MVYYTLPKNYFDFFSAYLKVLIMTGFHLVIKTPKGLQTFKFGSKLDGVGPVDNRPSNV